MATYSQRPVRSLLHPRRSVETPDTEPLPLYTPRNHEQDSDASSIVSEAPTYRSDIPPYSASASTYKPLVTGNGPPSIGLPYRKYAPGFEMRLGGSVGDVSSQSYNMATWSTTRSGPTIRQYKNVAKRRVQRDSDVMSILNSLATVPHSIMETLPTPVSASMSNMSSSESPMMANTPESRVPYSPAEDADLVGESAAATARRQRQSRERGVIDRRDALGGENRSWDFTMVQMKDWEGRGQSWNNFRKDMVTSKRGKLARRLGLAKR